MNLKTATLIALIGVLFQTALWLCSIFDLFNFSSPVAFKVYSIVNILLSNGTLALFLAVLYSKQDWK